MKSTMITFGGDVAMTVSHGQTDMTLRQKYHRAALETLIVKCKNAHGLRSRSRCGIHGSQSRRSRGDYGSSHAPVEGPIKFD
jgi:hypothetical protein